MASMYVVLFWNSVIFQADPGATARAFAIIHSTMHDSMVAFNRISQPIFKYNNMLAINNVPIRPSINAAITEAAFQTLLFMYPKQHKIFIADSILKNRTNDGSQINQTYIPSFQLGYHQADPTHLNQGFLGVHWGNVKPFLLNSSSQFRQSNVVGDALTSRLVYLNSTGYLRGFDEIKSLGSKTYWYCLGL